MIKIPGVLFVLGLLLTGQHLVAAADTDGNSVENSIESSRKGATANTDPAKELFEQHCVACHQPHKSSKSQKTESSGQTSSGGCKSGGCNKGKQSHGGRLAPPMPMVKKHYLRTYPQRSDFIEAVATWIANPQADAAQLNRAVERFGLMQALPLEKKVREQIAGYIYDKIPTGSCPKHRAKHK